MANDLAARSMAELDSDSLESPHTPSSPTKKKFSFKLKPSPPSSRRNFSTGAAGIPDIRVGCVLDIQGGGGEQPASGRGRVE